MKLEIQNNLVMAQAENEEESLQLVRLAHHKVVKPVVIEKKTRKKTLHIKKCEICGKGFRGLQGIGLHKARMHGIHSKNYELNKKYRGKESENESQKTPFNLNVVAA